MVKTTKTDHLKILRAEFKEVKIETWANTGAIKHLENRVKVVETDLGDFRSAMEKRFDDLDQKLFDWKSEIHDLIDEGFTSKAKAHDEEIGTLNVRVTRLEKPIRAMVS